MHSLKLGIAGISFGVALLGSAGDAAACGGTFCDSGPRAMPVDQTGENVVFVMDEGFVEAHVQIQYTGDPARFAWIVPMQKIPEVTVGSAQLFTNVLAGTVPTYGFTTNVEQCANTRYAKSASDSASGAAGAFPGVNVAYRKTVGAFDVTVLSGGSADEVVAWLDMNGYQHIDTAPAILQHYIDQQFVFAALKLTAGAGLDEIHPLVFRYPGSEPCVPLELTAVAAVDDMNVRTFFFGSERVVPENYRHVILNPVKIDWLQQGANYDTVVSRAVDAKGADGQGFVTEYAGVSSVVNTAGLVSPSWDASRFSALLPGAVVQELVRQGLADCTQSECTFAHPLIEPLLEEFLPAPAGLDPTTYYACMSCSPAADVSQFDPAKFAKALDERVFQPAAHAVSIVKGHPYLTRLYTRMSPDEMTLDPIFVSLPHLPDVALPSFATNHVYCSQDQVMELATGERVALGRTSTWPRFDDMPFAARIEDFSSGSSKPALIADNGGAIDSSLKAHNKAFGLDDSSCACALEKRTDSGAATLAFVGAGIAGALARRRRPRPLVNPRR
jgi:hypothetical protein